MLMNFNNNFCERNNLNYPKKKKPKERKEKINLSTSTRINECTKISFESKENN